MKKKSVKRNIIEWIVIVAIGGSLYFTGYHTEVIGRLQQVILWTGMMQPDIEIPPAEQKDADYQWRLRSGSGETVEVDSLRNKVLFINFWATWCPPCVAEMPNIHSLYEKVNSDDIVFLMISVDEDWGKVKDFMERKGYTFPVYRLATRLPDVFSSSTIPTTFVVSPAGKIVSVKKGLAKYDTESFRKFLEKLATDLR